MTETHTEEKWTRPETKKSSQGQRADDKKASDWKAVRVSRRRATEPECKTEMQWTERKEKKQKDKGKREAGRRRTSTPRREKDE